MKGPTVVHVEGVEGPVVGLRAFLEARASVRWPSQKTGRRGRPVGGGMRGLSSAMEVHPSRLSHLLADAEKKGRLSARDWARFARALGHETADDLRDDYLLWWRSLTEETT